MPCCPPRPRRSPGRRRAGVGELNRRGATKIAGRPAHCAQVHPLAASASHDPRSGTARGSAGSCSTVCGGVVCGCLPRAQFTPKHVSPTGRRFLAQWQPLHGSAMCVCPRWQEEQDSVSR